MSVPLLRDLNKHREDKNQGIVIYVCYRKRNKGSVLTFGDQKLYQGQILLHVVDNPGITMT